MSTATEIEIPRNARVTIQVADDDGHLSVSFWTDPAAPGTAADDSALVVYAPAEPEPGPGRRTRAVGTRRQRGRRAAVIAVPVAVIAAALSLSALRPGPSRPPAAPSAEGNGACRQPIDAVSVIAAIRLCVDPIGT